MTLNKDAIFYGIAGLIIGGLVTLVVIQCVGFHHGRGHHGRMEEGKERIQYSNDEKGATKEGMSMEAMNKILEGKTGDDFDKNFIEMMIHHHEGAIDMAELIPARAKHEEIKKLGQDIISAQTQEITAMKTWAKAWGYSGNEESNEASGPMPGMAH